MSDRIYTDNTEYASQNFVVVAQAASRSLVLTKRNFSDGTQKSYDQVKHYNLFEEEIWNLNDLYRKVVYLLDRPRCCIIRARLKDPAICRNVVRKCNGDDATLVVQDQNWFALDIDWKDKESYGDLLSDLNTVLLALGGDFAKAECFALGSASYLFKPGIRMRLFFWSQHPCSNTDLKRMLAGNQAGADLAIFNPVQPIYVARPIGVDPVKERIIWCDGNPYVNVSTYTVSHGDDEKRYTKAQALRFRRSSCVKIGELTPNYRHNGLITECIFMGLLIGQGLLDEDETIELILLSCDEWSGARDRDKDMKTITYAIERGKEKILGENVHDYR